MKQMAKSWWVRMSVLMLVVAGSGGLIAQSLTETSALETTFDAERYAAVIAGYEQSAFTCIQDIIDDWEWDVYTMLPVAPPDPSFSLHTGRGRSRLLLPDQFTKQSLNKLVPVTRSVGGRSYTAYPIRVREDPVTRARLIYATGSPKPKLLATVWPPLDYDPLWLYYDRYSFGSYSDLMKSLYDPSRIVCEMDLIEEEGVQAIAALSATITPSVEEIGFGGIMMMGYSGPSVTNIQIVGVERTNDAIGLTIAYPDDFTNDLEIFTTDGGSALIHSWWDDAGTTNIDSSTNWVGWIDHDMTNPIPYRFYRIWNADVDSDSDGFSDGFEAAASHTATDNSNSFPVEISGTISYTGSLTGPVRMIAVTVSNSWIGPMARIPVPGVYTNDKVANATSYWFKAYRDCDWDNEKEYGEPWGIYSNVSQLVTNDISGINITIGDKDEDNDGLIDWWEMQYFGDLDETPSTDPDSDGLTNGAERAEGTNPSDYDSDDDGLVDGYDGYCPVGVFTNGITAIDRNDNGYADGEIEMGTNPLDPNDPASIAGTVTYQTYYGGQTGTIYIVGVTNASSWSTNYCDSIASTGEYLIAWIPTNEVWVKAWRDSDGNGLVGTTEATGSYSSASIALSGDHTGIDIMMTDPDGDSDGVPDYAETDTGIYVSPTDTGTDPGLADSDSDGIDDGDEVAAGTDPNNSDTDAPTVVISWPMNGGSQLWIP